MKSSCSICDVEIEVQMCCSGHQCGCMGMPVDPPVCSEKCYDAYMNKSDGWINFEEEGEKLNESVLKNIELKFDNGDIRDFHNVWPMAVVTHFRIKK